MKALSWEGRGDPVRRTISRHDSSGAEGGTVANGHISKDGAARTWSHTYRVQGTCRVHGHISKDGAARTDDAFACACACACAQPAPMMQESPTIG